MDDETFFSYKMTTFDESISKEQIISPKNTKSIYIFKEIEFSVALRLDLSVIVLHIVVHTVVE